MGKWVMFFLFFYRRKVLFTDFGIHFGCFVIQELSAIVPAKEKHNIVKTAISKVQKDVLG